MNPTCPACGETERLSGSPAADDIEVSCQVCGHRWMRGSPRCRACGGEEAVHRLQLMTRHPRGNQLAVVGHREVPLCPRCDAEVLETAGDSRVVPEGHVSRFVFGRDEPRPVPSTPSPLRSAPNRARTAPPVAPARPESSRPATADRPPGGPPPHAAPPTVRQAIDAFLSASPDADALTMVMLGRHLGPSTRLQELDEPAVSTALQQWFRTSWGDRHSERRAAAAAAVVAAVDHWRAQGWVQADLAGFLR